MEHSELIKQLEKHADKLIDSIPDEEIEEDSSMTLALANLNIQLAILKLLRKVLDKLEENDNAL